MINFPDTPIINQMFSTVGKTWVWDGEKWGTGLLTVAGDDHLDVTGTVSLPVGFEGEVWVSNATGGSITITLPPSPNPDQRVFIKDLLGNAATYPIVVSGGGANIEGQLTITMSYNYSWVDLFMANTQWVQK